jgi:hypothetical protein
MKQLKSLYARGFYSYHFLLPTSVYYTFVFFLFSAVEVVAVIIIILNRSSNKIMETMSDKE